MVTLLQTYVLKSIQPYILQNKKRAIARS